VRGGRFEFPHLSYGGPFFPPGVGFGLDGMLLNPSYIHGEVKYGTCEERMERGNQPFAGSAILLGTLSTCMVLKFWWRKSMA
jgi:hypothetical protein